MTAVPSLPLLALIPGTPATPGIAAGAPLIVAAPAFPAALGLAMQPTAPRQTIAAAGADLPDGDGDHADTDTNDRDMVAAQLATLGLTPADPDPARALVALLAMPPQPATVTWQSGTSSVAPVTAPSPAAIAPALVMTIRTLRGATVAAVPELIAAGSPIPPVPVTMPVSPNERALPASENSAGVMTDATPAAIIAPAATVVPVTAATPFATDQFAASAVSTPPPDTTSAPPATPASVIAAIMAGPLARTDDSGTGSPKTVIPATERTTATPIPSARVVAASSLALRTPADHGKVAPVAIPRDAARPANGIVLSDPARPARFAADPTVLRTVTAAVALPVIAVTTADQPALDLADQRWPVAMIDHIERLRDGAEAASTRIRVVPDALGPIDVAVSRSGEAVDVRFTAAHEATRAMLVEARPALIALAAERGVAIGGTHVDAPPAIGPAAAMSASPNGGSERGDRQSFSQSQAQVQTQSQSQSQSQPQPHTRTPRQPLAPSPAAPPLKAADNDASASTRIA